MNKVAKIGIVVALAAAVVVALRLKSQTISAESAKAEPLKGAIATTSRAALPRLLELGSVTCIPCKMMATVLEELRKDYPGTLQVDFIDVNENRQAAEQFGIRVIPTQVFLDAGGKELFRHEGFFPKEEIVAKWKALGVQLRVAGEAQTK